MSSWAKIDVASTAAGAVDAHAGRGGHASVLLQGFAGMPNAVLIFGGADAFGLTSNSIRIVNVEARTVAVCGTPFDQPTPAPRCSHGMAVASCCATGARIVLYGGVNYLPQVHIFADLWELTLTTGGGDATAVDQAIGLRWTQLAPVAVPGPRHSFASCVTRVAHRRFWVVACGSVREPSSPAGPFDNALFALDLESLQWSRWTHDDDRNSIMPCEMATMVCVGGVDGSVLLFGGHGAVQGASGELEQALVTRVVMVRPTPSSSHLESAATSSCSVEARVLADDPKYCRVAHCAVAVRIGAPESDRATVWVVGGVDPMADDGAPMAGDDGLITLEGVSSPSAQVDLSRLPRRLARTGAAGGASTESLFFGLGASICSASDDARAGEPPVVYVVAGLLPHEVNGPLAVYCRRDERDAMA